SPRQQGLCAYCENRLDSDMGQHIEHVQPKSRYPEKTFDYDNLVLSCRDSDALKGGVDISDSSCGHYKGSRYNAGKFISPIDADCEHYFFYSLTGEILVSDKSSTEEQEKVNYTVNELLNLNCRRLVRERADILLEGFRILQDLKNQENDEVLKYFLDSELQSTNGKLQSYTSIREQHLKSYYPDAKK
ncbi:retron system putative HNH endonuclease, partial [Candidatus Venteria ishoeyi]|uniref:retron system putative HNH endonuclease n=1 Tax=Candidatus Venteria ishoeyi TaxID=1899563 RepID=UPI000CDE892B